MLDHQVLVFTGIAALLTITPGADTFLVIRNVLRGGRQAGVVTTLGICCGLFVHATLSALGLSIVLLHSANAYLALKWAGAVYLMWLGRGSIRDAIRGGDDGWSRSEPAETGSPRGERVAAFRLRYPFVEGMTNNVLNPKVAVFRTLFVIDRKSTRLNSSHLVISYAVFCLKKKKNKKKHITLSYRIR